MSEAVLLVMRGGGLMLVRNDGRDDGEVVWGLPKCGRSPGRDISEQIVTEMQRLYGMRVKASEHPTQVTVDGTDYEVYGVTFLELAAGAEQLEEEGVFQFAAPSKAGKHAMSELDRHILGSYLDSGNPVRERNFFHYFIIMPGQRQPLGPDTLFNKFNKQLTDSVYFLNLISHLPATLDELKMDWPFSAAMDRRDVNYRIIYMYENNILLPENIEMMEELPFGCFFFMNGVRLDTISLIRERSRLPVVSYEEGIPSVISVKDLSDEQVTAAIFAYWRMEMNRLIDIEGATEFTMDADRAFRPDQTGLSGWAAPELHYMRALVGTLNRVRGLYGKTNTSMYKTQSAVQDNYLQLEAEADGDITRSLKRLLLERWVVSFLDLTARLSVESSEDERRLLNRLGFDSREAFEKFIASPTPKEYEAVIERFEQEKGDFRFPTDMVFCIPSINYFYLNEVHKLLQDLKLPKALLRNVYDNSTYRPNYASLQIPGTTKDDQFRNGMLFNMLNEHRGEELKVMSQAHVFYALARRLPFVRLRNVPAFQLYQKAFEASRYSHTLEDKRKLKDFNENIAEISAIMKQAFPDEMANLMLEHGVHIKMISDLPIEWIRLNGLPLCVAKSMSRIPVTPGNGLPAHANTLFREYVLHRHHASILIVNALHPNDEKLLFGYGTKLYPTIQSYFEGMEVPVNYVEVKNKAEFMAALSEFRPMILVHYGHGSYNRKKDDLFGQLKFRQDYMPSYELEALPWKPPIVILGACETQAPHGSHLNVANMFLLSGSVSVLGAFFPVNGDHAARIISSILFTLSEALKHGTYERWSDLLWQTCRVQYLHDVVHSLDGYLRKKTKYGVDHHAPGLFERFTDYCIHHDISPNDMMANRDEIYMNVLEPHPVAREALGTLLQNNWIVPESLMFSSLGSPEYIAIAH